MTGQMTIEEVVATHLHKAKVAVDPMTLATEWRMENPDAFQAIVLMARNDVLNGHTPSINHYAEMIRRPHRWSRAERRCIAQFDIKRPGGHEFTINRTALPALVRMIEAENPDLNGAFRKCHSKVDVSDGHGNATPVVPLATPDHPACHPCQDSAQYGDWFCGRCENTTPHKEVEPPV